MFRIEHIPFMSQLWEVTQQSSVVLTGSPGVGKSWTIAQFIRKCRKAKRPVLPVAAEDFEVRSLEELSTAVGLGKDPIAFLGRLGEGAVFVVDGLDALRGESVQRPFRDLIGRVAHELPRCAVVASIRTYDLQQSTELQHLFFAQSAGPARRQFKQVSIGPLSDEDLAAAADQVPVIRSLLATASGDFLELLRNPFNLHLAARLLEEGTPVSEISTVYSQAQLLHEYWAVRLERHSDGPDRKAFLRTVVRKMTEANALSVREEDVYAPDAKSLLEAMQSDELLRRSATDRIFFTHNILFDYAVARLLLDEESIFGFIGAEPGRTIFFRPSLSFFFHHLWSNARELFWETAFRFIESAEVPPRAQVVPAVAIYELAMRLADLRLLLDTTSSARGLEVAMVLRAVQTFGGLQSVRRKLWIEVLAELTASLDLQFINEYIGLVAAASEGISEGDQPLLGSIARCLLQWTWDVGNRLQAESAAQLGDIGAMRVLPVVLRFYDSDAVASRDIVLKVADRCTRSIAGPHEAFWLAQGITSIVRSDPALAIDVYARLFGYQEESEDRTLVGGSPTFQLTSTRRQDYSSALYGLQSAFSTFLEVAPGHAARAAIESVRTQLQQQRPTTYLSSQVLTFKHQGGHLSYLADHSEIWDSGGPDYLSLQLLDAVLQHAALSLSEKGDNHTSEELVTTIIGVAPKRETKS